MITLTQLAGSTAPVQFAVEAIDAEGNAYDPTGDPVYVALSAITSPPTAFDPGTATWNSAFWSVQPGNPAPVYWVNILFGPLNGGVAVTAGSYIAYTKITDDPAVPILPSAYVIFT
jgi:hypothetical protein